MAVAAPAPMPHCRNVPDARGHRLRADLLNIGPDMAVYVDEAIWQWRGLRWCHLLADDTDELHRFAASLGIKPASYQGPPKTTTPHYDLTAYERRRAIAQGAVACGREAMVAVLHRVRVKGRGAGAEKGACA
jgi:hypothetical protein